MSVCTHVNACARERWAYNSTNSETRKKKDEGEYAVNNKPLPVLKNGARVGAVG